MSSCWHGDRSEGNPVVWYLCGIETELLGNLREKLKTVGKIFGN